MSKKAPQHMSQTPARKYTHRLSDNESNGKHETFRMTEEFFRDVINSLEDYAVFTTDKKGNVSSWNAGAENLLGYSEEEVIGKNSRIFFTSGDRKKKEPEKELKNATTKGTAANERYHVRKDGSLFWGSGQVFPLKDEKGLIRGFTKIMRNRSEKKLTEGRLSHFAAIVESSDDAIISRDLTGTILTWNNGAEKLFGYTAAEAIGKHIAITMPPKLKREVISPKILSQKHSDPITLDTTRKKKDGSLINVSVTVSPTKDVKGKLTGASIIARDITERKKLEETLSELAAIVEASDDAIIRRTLDGTITHWNKGATKLYGYTPEEAIGKSVKMLIPEDRFPDLSDIRKKLSGGKRMTHFETIRQKKDGTRIDVSISLSPINDAKGKMIAISTIARDITQQKLIERQKDEFLGIASHELKTPVTSIKAYTQLLHKRFIDVEDAASAELVGKMNSQLNKLNNLISDLLDVTKIERGKMQFEKGYFDFNELVNEVVEEIQRMAVSHTITKKLAKTKTMYGDRNRIGQVITNFLSNAIKYSPASKEVQVKTAIEKESLQFCVKDFGVGIPYEKQQKVFERFYRVSGAKQDTYPGLGLGLYISSEIITRQNGKIWVESTRGKGSQFCFSLPLPIKKK